MTKTKTEDQNAFYMRFHSVDTYRAVLTLSQQTDQPMREIVERACKFAFGSKAFQVPRRKTTADKLIAARERRLARLEAKAEEASPAPEAPAEDVKP